MKIELTQIDAALRGRINTALSCALQLVKDNWRDARPYINDQSWVSFASVFRDADDSGMKEEKVPLPFDSPDATLFALAGAVNRGCQQRLPGFVPFTPTTSVGPRSGDIIGFIIERLSDPPGGTTQKNLHALKIAPKPQAPPPEPATAPEGGAPRPLLRPVAPVPTVEEKFDIVLVTKDEAIRVLSGILAEIEQINKAEASATKPAEPKKLDPALVAALAKVPDVVRKYIETLQAENAGLATQLAQAKAAAAAAAPSEKPVEGETRPLNAKPESPAEEASLAETPAAETAPPAEADHAAEAVQPEAALTEPTAALQTAGAPPPA